MLAAMSAYLSSSAWLLGWSSPQNMTRLTGIHSRRPAKWLAAIIGSLDRLIAGRTSFVIAHRHSAIRHCDQIIHIEGGRLIGIRPAATAGFPALVAAGPGSR